MKKKILAVSIILTLTLSTILVFSNKTSAQENAFALTAISPEKEVSKCINGNYSSVTSAFAENGFNIKKEASGFIYSVIGYDAPNSFSSTAGDQFWSFWIREKGKDYEFSNLGPNSVIPKKNYQYVLYLGDGSAPPDIAFDKICKLTTTPPTATPSAIHSAEPTNTASNNEESTYVDHQPQSKELTNIGLDYLRNSFYSKSISEQEWATIALGSHSQPIEISDSNYDSVLDVSRQTLAFLANGQKELAQRNSDIIKNNIDQNQIGEFDLINDDIFGALVLSETDKDFLHETGILDHIVSAQNSDGGFGYAISSDSDVDMTAAALWALKIEQQKYEKNISNAFSYLRSAQNNDGGFGYIPNQPSNIASSSWTLIAYNAFGVSLDSTNKYIVSQQQPNGSWQYFGQESFICSAYAILALSGKTLPITNNTPIPEPNPQQPNPISQPSSNPQPILPPENPNDTTPQDNNKSSKSSSSSASASSSASVTDDLATSASSSSSVSCNSGKCSASSSASSSYSANKASASSSASSSCN